MGYFLDYDSDVKTSSFIPLIIISIFVSGLLDSLLSKINISVCICYEL